MNKLVYYSIGPRLVRLLDNSLVKYEERYKIKIAATTFHGSDRLTERDISLAQRNILAQLALKRIAFTKEQVSEVRIIEINNQQFPVSVVVDDVVIGIHPKNLPERARQAGFGTREGEFHGVIKTVLARENVRPKLNWVDEYKVMG